MKREFPDFLSALRDAARHSGLDKLFQPGPEALADALKSKRPKQRLLDFAVVDTDSQQVLVMLPQLDALRARQVRESLDEPLVLCRTDSQLRQGQWVLIERRPGRMPRVK